MDAKQFLKNKGIFDTQYIINCDGESISIEILLIEYQALQLKQSVANQSVCKHEFISSVAYKGARICKKCNEYQ